MTTFDETPGSNPLLIPYRVRQNEQRIQKLEDWKEDVDEDRRDIKYLRSEMNSLTNAVDDLKKILIRTSITVAVSALMVLVSVLVGSGKIPG